MPQARPDSLRGRELENWPSLLAGARCHWALVLAYAFLVWFSFLGGWRVFQ